MKKSYSPFSAVVGQEKLKTLYLANIVNPRLGGLLITGPKGSGKSSVVHCVKSKTLTGKALPGEKLSKEVAQLSEGELITFSPDGLMQIEKPFPLGIRFG